MDKRKKSKLTDEEIVSLYEELSVTAIAEIDGTSHVNVLRKLHRLKVPMRSKGHNELRIAPTIHGYAKRAKELGLNPNRYVRLKAIQRLGGKCVGCGVTDIRVLQLNHVNGEGKVRGSGRVSAGYSDCVKVLLGHLMPLDVRCANCNIIHEYDRGNLIDVSVLLSEDERG